VRQGPMRVYVAGRFTHYERCRALMDELAATGHTITHDWTRTEEFGDDGHPVFEAKDESGIPPERLAMHAQDDVRGVRTADLVVVLADDQLCGALIEIGCALAYDVPVWVVAPWRWTIFWEHPLVDRFETVDEVRDLLGAAARIAPQHAPVDAGQAAAPASKKEPS
jgi:hypothetical protein